jgi:hypothetical protein
MRDRCRRPEVDHASCDATLSPVPAARSPGPYEVFARFEELNLHLVWKTRDPVSDVNGLRILPTDPLAACLKADILFVPGGSGQVPLMEDQEVLSFFRQRQSTDRRSARPWPSPVRVFPECSLLGPFDSPRGAGGAPRRKTLASAGGSAFRRLRNYTRSAPSARAGPGGLSGQQAKNRVFCSTKT